MKCGVTDGWAGIDPSIPDSAWAIRLGHAINNRLSSVIRSRDPQHEQRAEQQRGLLGIVDARRQPESRRRQRPRGAAAGAATGLPTKIPRTISASASSSAASSGITTLPHSGGRSGQPVLIADVPTRV